MQARNIDVDAELGDARGLFERIDPRKLLADVLEVSRPLQRCLRRRFKRRSGSHELAIREPFAIDHHMAAVGGERRNGPFQLTGCGLHQHGANIGAHLAQLPVVGLDRRAAASALHAELRVGVVGMHTRPEHFNLPRGHIELLSHQGGQPGVDALPHLIARAVEAEVVLRGDLQEGIGHEVAFQSDHGRRAGTAAREREADHQPAAGNTGGLEKAAPGDVHQPVHQETSVAKSSSEGPLAWPATDKMACLMRG